MKRMMVGTLGVCLLMLLSIGTSAQSKDEMKRLVAAMNQEMIDMLKAGRIEAMGKFYDADAISLPNYRAMEKGYKLILNNNLGRQKGGYKIIEGEKTTTKLIITEEMLVDIGQYTLMFDFPGLKEPRVDNGKYLNVWKKDKEGKWRIVAETWNANKSPNAPAARKNLKPGSSGSNIKANPGAGGEPKPAMDTKDGKK